MKEQRFYATNLDETIRQQGRTKRWVAGRAGFSESMLGHVIARRKSISLVAAERIAASLDVPFFLLFESTSVDQTSPMQEQAA